MKLIKALGLLRPPRLRQWMRGLTILRCGFAVLKRIGTGHHTNGVDEKLSRDARFLLVLSESEQADTRNNHNGWIGIAKLWRIRRGPCIVVLLIIVSVGERLLADFHLEHVDTFARIPVDE